MSRSKIVSVKYSADCIIKMDRPRIKCNSLMETNSENCLGNPKSSKLVRIKSLTSFSSDPDRYS